MGAYENPPIINPPNYGEIFMKNFITMFDYTKKLKAEKAADPGKANRIKEAKAARQDYRKESKAVRKGATGVELTKVIDNGRTFINDISNKYISGSISWDQYNNGINKTDGLLNTLNTLKDRFALEGQALEELEKAGISNYQTSPVGGLITAFKNNQVIPEVNEDYELTGLTYTIYDKENKPITQTIPIDALSDKRFFSVNESYVTEYAGLKESLEKIYAGKDRLDASFEKTTKTDTGSITKKYTKWKNNYNPAIAIQDSTELAIVFNSDENAGSIYEDILTLNWGDEDYTALADELIKENKLTGKNAEILREIIQSKEYSNINIAGEQLDKKVSAKNIINNWSKKQIAEEISNKANSEYLFKGKVIAETIDDKEKPEDAAKEFVDLFFEDPAKVYTDSVVTGATGEKAGASYKAPFVLGEEPDTSEIILSFPGQDDTTLSLLSREKFGTFINEAVNGPNSRLSKDAKNVFTAQYIDQLHAEYLNNYRQRFQN